MLHFRDLKVITPLIRLLGAPSSHECSSLLSAFYFHLTILSLLFSLFISLRSSLTSTYILRCPYQEGLQVRAAVGNCVYLSVGFLILLLQLRIYYIIYIKRGRPRKTWIEEVQTAMTARNLKPDHWRNREEWRLVSGRR